MSDDLVRRLWKGIADTDAQQDAADRIEALEAAIKRQAGASRTLRAHTLAEVQHLKDMDRSEYNAAKSLDSEREANAILTAQVEALTAQLAQRRALSAAACGKWAEVSQANYRRAKEAESQLAQRDAQVEALTAERDALRADDCDPDGCAAHISAFASQVDALTAQLAQRDAALRAALEVLQDIRDHGGEDWVVEKAFAFLAAYRKARGQDDTAH